MRVPILSDQREEFDERNLVLQLTLGALCWAERLDALLERHAPEGAAVAEGHAREADPDALAALLGLISLRGTLARTLEGALSPTPPGAAVTAPPSPAQPSRWLR